jgi:hypothetical protein
VGSRIKAARLAALSLSLALTLTSFPAALAESDSATPTVSSEPSPSISATPTPTTSPSKSPSPKVTPTKKATTKKKKISPSPKPVWPPKGFKREGEVYAKIPSSAEMVSIISASTYLQSRVKACKTFICGRVQVAAEAGCLWWQALAYVEDGKGKKLGDLSVAFGSSAAREFKTFILISPEGTENGGDVKIASVICHHVDRDKSQPTVDYKKVTA